MPTIKRQGGFTLIELLVGLAVSLIVLTGVLTVFVATLTSSAETLRMARLNQELRAIMDIMVHDIRRAGYSAAQPGTDTNGDGVVDKKDLAYNPFTQGDYDLTISGSCIFYTYNLDKDDPPKIGVGSSGTASATTDTNNNELFGFKLDNGAIKMRAGGSNPGCASGTWSKISSSDITITSLALVLTTKTINVSMPNSPNSPCVSGDSCQLIRSVDISMTGVVYDGQGQVLSKQTINDTVRVRNDKFYVVP